LFTGACIKGVEAVAAAEAVAAVEAVAEEEDDDIYGDIGKTLLKFPRYP
jgi:hypothetical protein